MWTDIRSVGRQAPRRGIKLTSIDLVRFTWNEKSDNQEDVESEEDKEDETNLNHDNIAPIK